MSCIPDFPNPNRPVAGHGTPAAGEPTRSASTGGVPTSSALARRALAGAALAALAAPRVAAARTGPAADDAVRAWRRFRDRYVTAEGRVLDTGNGNISHSEGQGLGLLFAARGDDRASFDRILQWTRRVLRRPDGLHAWRYRPDAAVPVADTNCATDGELYIAWGLAEGAQRWQQPGYRAEAAAIAASVLRQLVYRIGDRSVLLPGLSGFTRADGRSVVVNPSYYVLPAIRRLAPLVPDPAWLVLLRDGLALLRQARFGRWGLPPDWLEVTGDTLRLPADWPPRFSFDAVRLPLFLFWVGLGSEPGCSGPAALWRDMRGRLPAWVRLTDDTPSPEPASPGVREIAATITGARLDRPPSLIPSIRDSSDYYSDALRLLSLLTRDDISTVGFPKQTWNDEEYHKCVKASRWQRNRP